MESIGYKVAYDPTFEITQTSFDQNVIAMKNAGVKILFLEQMPENYAASVVQALDQQDFHPVLVLGGSTYSERLVADSGGAKAIDGAFMDQAYALFLGEDASQVPAVSTFLNWVQKASPGFKPDLYTLFGWLSGELFTQALQAAGKPSDAWVGAPEAGHRHQLRRDGSDHHGRPGPEGPRSLLRPRPDRTREVPAAGRSAGHRDHPRVPL